MRRQSVALGAGGGDSTCRAWNGRVPIEMLGPHGVSADRRAALSVTLPPYGFFWFPLAKPRMKTRQAHWARPEFVTLVLGHAPDTMFDWSRRALERDVLPGFLAARRWYGDKDVPLRSATLWAACVSGPNSRRYYIALVDAETERGTSRYVLPVTVEWKRVEQCNKPPANILAAVRRGPREGTLLDAAAEQEFITLCSTSSHAGETIEGGSRRLKLSADHVFRDMPPPAIESVQPVNREQSNTTVIVDVDFVVKLYPPSSRVFIRRRRSGGS